MFFTSEVIILMIPILVHGVNPPYENIEEECRCVPSHLCADNDAAVDGQGLLDIRMESQVCPNYFEVCCETLKDPTNTAPAPAQTQETTPYKGCGYPTPELGLIPRITSKSEISQFGELPWTVVILMRDVSKTERNMYRCGGSLIHPQVALTAAHCVFELNSKHLTVRAGEWNTKSQDEPLPHQDVLVQEIVLHPQYNSGSLKNDLALLFFQQPVMLTGNVGVVCLPPPGLNMDDARCIASGWGKDAVKKGKHSTILKKVDVPIVNREKCLAALRSTRLGGFYNLHKSFICAGGERDKDTCKGDGGSPLVCNIPGQKGRFVQMGVVSWGIGCGENLTPGVYVNVALYSDWIDKQLFAKNLDMTINKY